MTKKTWSLLGILVIAMLLLAACGGGETAPANQPAEEAGEPAEEAAPAKIVLWHALKDTETAGLTKIIEDFKTENPNVEFEVLFVPFDDLRGKFETAAGTGGGPDLLIGGDDWGPPMYDASLIADVSGVAVSDINEAAMNVGKYKDAQVGLPYVLKGVVMFRNAAIIAEPAVDFADLKAKAEAATTGDTFGALLEIGGFFSFGHLYGLGGALMTPAGDPAFNAAEGEAWLAMLEDFRDLGADNWYNDNDVNLFKEGKVGVVIDGTWNLGDFSAALGEDLVVDAWPSDMSGFVQTGMIYLNANSVEPNLNAAKNFMGYLLSNEAQTAFYQADGAFIPSNTTVEVTDPLRQQALTAFSDGTGSIVIPEMGAYWGPTETMIISVLEGEATAAEALAAAETSVNEALIDIRGQ